MGKGNSWPLDWKIELWELVTKNQKDEKKIISRKQAWEFKLKYPQLTEQAILGMARRLSKYSSTDELEKRESHSWVPFRWSNEEDGCLLKATEGIEEDEVRLTTTFCELADKFNRSPSAVRSRWLKLKKNNINGLFSVSKNEYEKTEDNVKNYEDLKDEVRWLQLALKQIGDLVNFSMGNNYNNNQSH